MDLSTVAFFGFVGWLVLMWRMQGVSTDLKILRAEMRKGKPLTLDEEEGAAFDQPPAKNA